VLQGLMVAAAALPLLLIARAAAHDQAAGCLPLAAVAQKGVGLLQPHQQQPTRQAVAAPR
jgi:hypothetical protein